MPTHWYNHQSVVAPSSHEFAPPRPKPSLADDALACAENSSPAGAHYAPVYSYNCSAPPNPPELLRVALDCHWLDGTTLLCCLIQVISALWPLPPAPPPPKLLSRKYFTCPLLTSAASWLVVRMGSLPEKPPRVITGLFDARMMASAPLELGTATRYFAVP